MKDKGIIKKPVDRAVSEIILKLQMTLYIALCRNLEFVFNVVQLITVSTAPFQEEKVVCVITVANPP